MSRYMDMSSTTQVVTILVRHRRPSGSSWTKFLRSSTCWPLEGKTVRRISKKFFWDLDGKNTELGMSFCSPKTGTVLIGNVDDFKWMEERQQNMAPMCKKLMNMLVLTNQYVSLSICNWDALNVNVKWTRMLLINTEKCSNHEFLLPQLEKLPGWVKLRAKTVAWSYDMEGHARSAWRGIVNWQSKRHSNCTQFQRLAWMITTSRRRSWKESENHPMYALKWSWNACIRLELADLTFFGPWTKLLARSPNGHELVTDV